MRELSNEYLNTVWLIFSGSAQLGETDVSFVNCLAKKHLNSCWFLIF